VDEVVWVQAAVQMKSLALLTKMVMRQVEKNLAPSNLWRKGWLIRSEASQNPLLRSRREE
jgi:hypothetical protein